MLRYTIKTRSKPKTNFTRFLRSNQTNGEKALWKKLRAKRLRGIKFRRQAPIGPYIVDFLCVQKNLIIEIDGSSHYDPGAKEKDAQREEYLKGKGFSIVRFTNTAAVESTDWVLSQITNCIFKEKDDLPLPSPLPKGEGMSKIHTTFMQHCLHLAQKGQGHTGINPLVGAVLVRNNQIVAQGYHAAFGEDHAERALLKSYDHPIKETDVLYINLEPCCHQGKTPPCTDIIIESGIKNVVYGMRDPNPQVAGKGIQRLQKAGIHIQGPVAPELCTRLNRGFVALQKHQRPHITLKRAQTRQKCIAQPDGSPIAITSHTQNVWSHTWLRNRSDAILVGVGTIIADNPELTVRHAPEIISQPYRIILDPSLRIPQTSKVIQQHPEKTIIICSEAVDSSTLNQLRNHSVTVHPIPMQNDLFDWTALWNILTTPTEQFSGIKTILLEGGERTWQIFRQHQMIDEEIVLSGKWKTESGK